MIEITLKGGAVKTYDAPVTAAEVAKDIGMGLYKSACVARVDGKVCDLRTELTENCALEILTFDDEDGKLKQGQADHKEEELLQDGNLFHISTP